MNPRLGTFDPLKTPSTADHGNAAAPASVRALSSNPEGRLVMPKRVLWGPEAAYGLANFHGMTLVSCGEAIPTVIEGLGFVKKATAQANYDLGAFGRIACPAEAGNVARSIRDSIMQACDEMIAGTYHDQFALSPIQGGAGTSLHLTAIEVLANRSNELLLGRVATQGRCYELNSFFPIHPNDTVNFGQSTNDAVPTAIRIGMLLEHEKLNSELLEVEDVFRTLGYRYAKLKALARTHLQDATGMCFGRRFDTMADVIGGARELLASAAEGLAECTLGATAVGTGITALPGFSARVLEHLNDNLIRAQHPIQLRPAVSLYAATASVLPIANYNATMAVLAGELSKIASDLRFLASGPRGGIGEIVLPAVQAGSSIMPGKVNPVMLELWNQVAANVRGNNYCVQELAAAGQLELNVMGPTIVYRSIESLRMLRTALGLTRTRCLAGMTVDRERVKENLEHSLVAAVPLKKSTSYAAASALSKEALNSGRSIEAVLRDKETLGRLGLQELGSDPTALLARAFEALTEEVR